MAASYVSETERDQQLGELLKQADNHLCFDCKGKNPKWASSSIGIFICYDCTTKHRHMGTHISFCRSISMDKWKAKEIKMMQFGGNKKAHTFYTKNNMFTDGRPNHENPALSKYKMALVKLAMEALGEETKSQKPPLNDHKVSELLVKEEKKENTFFENPSKPPPLASKIINDPQTSSSVYSFTNLKQNNQPVNLNAKKLDVVFGGDDFFDSFGMGDQTTEKPKASSDNPFAVAEPLQNDESGPFQLGSSVDAKTSATSDNDEFVKQKLKELEGKKAISSEDFKNPADEEYKDNFKRFSGAQAISSNDFFGEPEKDNTSQDRSSLSSFGRDSFGDKVSEAAIYAADKVAQNAKKLKEKASNFFSAFSRPSE
jgi:hypothetical protein